MKNITSCTLTLMLVGMMPWTTTQAQSMALWGPLAPTGTLLQALTKNDCFLSLHHALSIETTKFRGPSFVN